MDKPVKKAVRKYCQFCEFTGTVHDSGAYITGEELLHLCPKCSGLQCKCGAKPPYYYAEEGRIVECPVRGLHIKIDRIKSLYQNSGIDKKYVWRFINEFNSVTKHAENAKKLAYELITTFPHVEKGLYLWGNPGTGKTLLSTIILSELITRYAVEGRFLKISRNFFDKIRATYNENSSSFGQGNAIENEIANIDVLVIDDFGTQRNSAWELETLYDLVDARYEAEKFTIFTSNFDPDKAMKDLYEGRILSRIKAMCRIVDMSGPDQREQ
jgi:DNA replication protein DnaC